MEDDLPLIEISGEDDSLLGSNADDNLSYFACSPFHLNRSKSPHPKSLGQMMRNQSAEKSSSSHRESVSVGKQNVHSSEAAKLGLEPQTMKKKKKAFNLRKSLAWNRAFFTEEGVLDSDELLLLSGNLGEPCRNMLSSINEDGPSSSVHRSARKADNSRTTEKKSFKEGSPRSEQKNCSGDLSSKFRPSLTRSPAKPSPVKKDANKIGSKRSGCPRPMASSALKRPANVNMTKGAIEETKIPKNVVRKPNSLTIFATSNRAAGADKVKGNHPPPPVVNAQKRVGLRSSSRNINNQNNEKSGLPSRSVTAKSGLPGRSLSAKSSAEARKKLGSLPSESHKSADKVNTVNIGLKVIQEPEHISAVNGVINQNAKCTKIPSLSQSGHSVGGSTQIAPPPMVKPSGLRMPSPSLQFFGSSKDSSSRNMLPRRSQIQSEIRNSRKMTSLKPVPGKPPATPVIEAVNVMTATGIISGSCCSEDCPLPSSTSTISCDDRKINLKANSERQLDVKVACISNTNERTDSQQYIHNDVQQQVEDRRYQNYDNKMLEHNGIEKRVEKDDDDTKRDDQVSPKIEPPSGAKLKLTVYESHHTNIKQLAGDIQHQASAENLGIYSESRSAHVNSHSIQGSSCLLDDQNCGIGTGNKKSRELVDTTKPCSMESSHVFTHSEQPHGHEATLESGPSEEFCIVDNSEEGYQTASEPGRSDRQVYSSDVKQAKDDFGSDELGRQSHLRYAQVKWLDINPSLQNNKDSVNTSTVDYQHVLDALNDQPVLEPENLNPCLEIRRASHDNCGSQLISCFFQEESFFSQEYQPENYLPNVKPNTPERADAFESVQEISSFCGPEMTDEECLHFDDVAAAGSIEATSQCCGDSLNQASEKLACNRPERISLLTVPDTAVADVCQNSAYLSIKELENPQSTFHFNSPRMDDAIDLESMKSRQGDPLVNINNSIPNLQPEENISSWDKVNEECTEQAKQIESCSVETDMDLEEGNQIPETYDHPFSMKEKSFEEYGVIVANHIYDVSSKKVIESAHGPYQLDQTEQSNEERFVGVNSASKELIAGNKNVQPFDGSISFQNGSTNVGALAEEGQYSVVEDKIEEAVENTEVKIPGFAGKEVSGSVEIKLSAGNHETFIDEKLKNDCSLGGQASSMEFDLYSSSAAEVSWTENDSKALCLAEDPRFLVNPGETSSEDIVQEAEVSLLNKNSLTEAETGISQDDTASETAMQDELNASSPMEAKDETSYPENRHDTKQGKLAMDGALDLENNESRQGDLLVNICNSIPNLQPGENITFCDQANMALLSSSPSILCNVNEESTEQAKQIESCSVETDMELEEDNQAPEADHHPFPMMEKRSEDYSVVVAGEIYDVSPKNVTESAHGPYQLDQTEQSNEVGSAVVNSPGMDDAIDLESVESRQGGLLVNIRNSIPNWQPGDDITSCDQGNLTLLSPSPGALRNVNEESTVQAKQIESCSLEMDMELEEDNQIPETYHHPSSMKEKCFEDYSIVDADEIHDVSPELVTGSPHGSYLLDQTEQSDEEGSARVDSASKELLMGDKNVQPFHACISFQNGSNYLGASAEEDQSSAVQDKIEASVENTEFQIPYFTEKEFDLSSPSQSQIFVTENDSKAFCLAEDSRFFIKPDQTSRGDIAQEAEVSLLNSNTLTQAGTGISQDGSETEMQNELNASSPMEVKDEASHLETRQDTKQGNLVIKPPPCAVPFSDEWLAAFEAAGEEILTMKGGAVQNSPPDKALPEPSPWSPVKRKKNQGIGPFDCTKFTNPNIPPPGSS